MKARFDEDSIWKPCSIKSVDDILEFEDGYRKLLERTTDELLLGYGLIPHDFGDGSLRLMERGDFKLLAKDLLEKSDDVFISCGCTQVESLVLHSFLNFESCLYRKDSYYNRIPPIVNSLCKILDSALENLPICDNSILFRSCVCEDRKNFKIGEIFEPGYVLTTTVDETWRDKSANRYIITPLKPTCTRARAIYIVQNKANEYQVSFLSTARFIIRGIEDWGEDKKAFLMEEII